MSILDHLAYDWVSRITIIGAALLSMAFWYPIWVHYDQFHPGSERSKRIMRQVMLWLFISASVVVAVLIPSAP